MAKKIRRKDLLKSEDEFLNFSARALSFFSAHVRELKIAGILIAAGCVIFLGTTAYFRHVNNKGQEAYNAAYSAMAEHISPEIEPDNLREVRDLFVKVVEDHGRSRAADLALPQLAFLKFMEGEFDGAIRLYSDFQDRSVKKDDFVTLSVLALASSHEANGDLNRAIALIETIAGDRGNHFRETALFMLTRLYGLAGQHSRAAELAGDFLAEFQRSPFVPIVKTYL